MRDIEESHKYDKLAGDSVNQGVCWGKLVYELPMHAQQAQESMRQKNIIWCSRIFCTHIVWHQLTHFYGR